MLLKQPKLIHTGLEVADTPIPIVKEGVSTPILSQELEDMLHHRRPAKIISLYNPFMFDLVVFNVLGKAVPFLYDSVFKKDIETTYLGYLVRDMYNMPGGYV